MSSLLSEELLKDVELKKLLDEEKKTRLDNEYEQNRKISVKILSTIYERNDFENFLKLIEYLTQRRNQSRESISAMIKYCNNEIIPNLKEEEKLKRLLDVIIKVTEGKIFVELEYSQAIRKMAEIHTKNNNLDDAAKLIQDVQIEAFGSLERDYKVDYILFQMETLILKGDFIRTLIVSNKIHKNHLNDETFELLKIRFYNLMIRYYIHEKKYLDVSKCYKILYDFIKEINDKLDKIEKDKMEMKTKVIENYINAKKDNNLYELFQNYVLYLSICPPELETKNMYYELQLNYKKELDANKIILYIVKTHLSDDIVIINDNLFGNYIKYKIFEDDKELLKLFRKYWIQHDLLIYSKFFSKIHLKRISEMTSVSIDEIESELADMVVNNYVYAKINRIENIVNFQKKMEHHDVLDELNYDLRKMLEGLEQTCHLINKEYLKYGINE